MEEFCDKCGSIMVPEKKRKKTYLKCRQCGHESKKPIKSLKMSEKAHEQDKVVVLEKDRTNLPTTEKVCPDCNGKKAYWWLQQTRGED